MKKKILALLMTSVMVLGVAACSSSQNSTPNTDNQQEEQTEPEGTTGPISVISREEGSGTRGAFVELMGVVDDDDNDITTVRAEITNSTSVMLTTVAGNPAAIGYVSLGSLSNDVKAVKVDGVEATTDNVKSGTYAVARPFLLAYKDGSLSDIAQDYLNFIMSADGQKIIGEEGYISVADGEAYAASGLSGKLVLAGSTSVIEGVCDFGMSSRELKDSEKAELTSTQIAMDGIAVVVNNANTVEDLSSETIKGIYLGEITDWADAQ